MDEGELLQAWAKEDKLAGKQLFERYYDPISRFFRNKVAEPADLVQLTFLNCLEAAGRYKGGNFRSFLFGIAINTLRQHYREHGRGRWVDADEQPSVEAMGISPSQAIAAYEEQRLLLAALRRLPVDLQTLLELHYWEQMKISELSELLEMPEGTIKSRLRKGRQLVEKSLAELAESQAVLDSTISGFDRWASELRELNPRR